jgi:hypothetical protein
MGLTIHPRVKRQVGARLAQAAWSLVYGHTDTTWTGPVISGCEVVGEKLKVKFNQTLLKSGAVAVRDYNKTEEASVMWVRTEPVPSDADKSYQYQNRQPWWGDSIKWVNVDIDTDPNDKVAVLVTLHRVRPQRSQRSSTGTCPRRATRSLAKTRSAAATETLRPARALRSRA